LESSRNARFIYVRKHRQHFALRVKHKFTSLMALKSFTGEIKLDDVAQTLKLEVIPRDIHDSSEATKVTKKDDVMTEVRMVYRGEIFETSSRGMASDSSNQTCFRKFCYDRESRESRGRLDR
jgi:hypothetical protein